MRDLSALLKIAREMGASEAVVVTAGDIVIEESLAAKCREPRCENYGLAKSCPPHVAGPAALRNLLQSYPRAILFKIDVPAEILFSSQSREVFQLLHEVASGVERSAAAMGYTGALAFAGGSCKTIFCREHKDCAALAEEGACRHPETARPSMSGFGIDVSKLFAAAGWEMSWVSSVPGAASTKMANVCGLVLIRKPEPENQNGGMK